MYKNVCVCMCVYMCVFVCVCVLDMNGGVDISGFPSFASIPHPSYHNHF